jgi:hypothetical protein
MDLIIIRREWIDRMREGTKNETKVGRQEDREREREREREGGEERETT